MCGLPFHLQDRLPLTELTMYYRHLASITLSSILAVFSAGCAQSGRPRLAIPPDVTAHAVISGVHDVVSSAHEAWSHRLNARVIECESKHPPATSTRDEFLTCLKPFDRNDEVVTGLKKLVEIQHKLKSFSGSVGDVLVMVNDAMTTARNILSIISADENTTNRVGQLKELYVNSTSTQNP